MAKGASISGFPEWLPSERVVEQRVIDTLRKVFELNGFIGIETRAVETGASLLKKGETSKEIYLLSRLQEVGHESDTPIEERLGLHFDLTVPLSRYVVEHSGALAFPFKRWQIQKVWRGERPQEGRFREFVQADIDVIGAGDLPDHYEVELPLVMVSALEELRAYGLPKATVHANNRKLSEGFYRGLGLTDVEGVLREIDKLDKIGADEVARLLTETCGATEAQARACLELAELTASDGAELAAKFDALCEAHGIAKDSESYTLARQGLDTLAMIVDEAAAIRPGSVIADLKIARGLDYYTGSVYETFLDGAASLGSICSGGRYDNLASQGNRKYPGVGLSIGLSDWSATCCTPPALTPAVSARPPCWSLCGMKRTARPPIVLRTNCVRAASLLTWHPPRPSSASRSSTRTNSAFRTCGSRPPLPKVRKAQSPLATRSRTSSRASRLPPIARRGSRILWLPSKPSKSDVFARKIEEKQDNEPDGLQNTSCH
ncbi:histidyl-tRNA synthetase [Bifidobacterium longum subsp. longum]|nr:histidyl-tRNA synthetase [Bifidobacterium longum subsp. longum]